MTSNRLRVVPALLALASAPILSQPALAASAATESAHIVTPGETLGGIANRAGVPASAIARANGLTPPYVVRTGQTLTIPREVARTGAPEPSGPASTATRYTVTSGETLNGIANRTGVAPDAIARANGIPAPYVVRVGETLTIPRGETTAPRVAARAIPARAAASPSPASSTPASSDGPETYMVNSGETLGGIANRTGVPRVLIAEANGLQPPYIVRAGQKLHIPRTRHHTVTQGDTGFSLALKYGVPWEQIAVASGIAPGAPLSAGQKLVIPSVLAPAQGGSSIAPAPAPTAAPAKGPDSRFLWPVKGPIRREFATGADYHDGLDITAAKGTMVRAAAAGKVLYADKRDDQFGNLVVIDHGDGWFTAYAFLSRITVKKGAQVGKGERIGLVGSTGLAEGNELHFEIRKDGKPVNPVDELPKAP